VIVFCSNPIARSVSRIVAVCPAKQVFGQLGHDDVFELPRTKRERIAYSHSLFRGEMRAFVTAVSLRRTWFDPAAASGPQPLHPALLVTIKDLVACLAGVPNSLLQIRHLLAG